MLVGWTGDQVAGGLRLELVLILGETDKFGGDLVRLAHQVLVGDVDITAEASVVALSGLIPSSVEPSLLADEAVVKNSVDLAHDLFPLLLNICSGGLMDFQAALGTEVANSWQIVGIIIEPLVQSNGGALGSAISLFTRELLEISVAFELVGKEPVESKISNLVGDA